jgi:diguanylate cyclase (GGDEF)-like protein
MPGDLYSWLGELDLPPCDIHMLPLYLQRLSQARFRQVLSMQMLAIHYNVGLVIVSVLLSIGASFAALSLSDRVRAATTVGPRRFWLTSGSVAMGVGVWSMHYLGMLALTLPVPIFYFWPTVLLSLLLAIAASRVALSVVSKERLTARRLLGGGLMMGAGIGAMHYTGMAAMRFSAMEHYNPWIVALSVITAAGLSWLALWIAFVPRRNEQSETRMRMVASVVMGLGIAAMHYIAMVGVRFTLSTVPFSISGTIKVGGLGESVIAVVTGLILLAALGTATLDKWRFQDLQKAHKELMQAQEALLASQQELREVNAMLNELSVRDGLTGLYNRRHFDAALDTELRRAARNLRPISLLMIDIDCFKALNDGYGHQRGDDCLREVARVLAEHPRRGYDVVARYGGEEFVLLLPDADSYAARAAAESIRHAVHALKIENHGSAVSNVVTVSVGVCCDNSHLHDEPGQFVQAADEALYAAKRLGRNRVEVATELPVSA